MKHKMLIITGVSALIAAVMYCFNGTEWCFTLAIVASTTCYHFAMRLGVGYFVSGVVKPKFNYNNFWFKVKKWELKAFKIIGVRGWKDKFPTYSPEKFDLKSGADELIQATCEAELIHTIIIILSYLPLAVAAIWGDLTDIVIFAVTGIVAGFVDFLFVIIQRYNRPRLIKLKQQLARKNNII